ncbi:LOW QUALITY PROTEIN: TPR repeat-containing protein DDB_G0287407-like [Amphiura filiformis]|uniref:LOW QUALITY PROTEIN: TPR repeat-containing protein DDB_G0287407-like n=1 Tax=Amphiura filiformis TaxID=82378 RepID=UPI003B21C0A3
MGCGSSHSYSYGVTDVWDQVSRTVDVKSRDKKKLVIPRSSWKTIRIFVSSTFRDFHAEREVLVKEVFPDLRQWCEKRRLHLVDCDLRWGVPKDTTSEETLRICLGEIDRCYDDNGMPFFLNLTSPGLLPGALTASRRSQPNNAASERCGWVPNRGEVPESLSMEYKWVMGLSVTEMEIMHGAYRKDNPNSLFLIRNAGFLDSVPTKYHQDFVDANPVAPDKMQMLKKMIAERFGEGQVSWYDCEYDCINEQNQVQFKNLAGAIGKQVFDFFKKRIAEQYPLTDISMDPYQQAKEAHESFMKSRSVSVLGRTEILDQIKEHVVGIGVDAPLILLGGPGSGKSSIMARVADFATAKALTGEIPGGGDKGWHVFYHFVGAVPGSPNLEATLKRLLKELGIVKESTMPKDLETTCQAAFAALSNPNTRPVIIVIDALNQFDECKEASVLNWLPSKLATQVRCVFSMIDETPQHQTLRSRPNKPTELYVTPLDMASREAIVKETLGKYNKRLDKEQMASLLGKDSSQNPLWLSIACEELRVFGSFDKLNDKINSLADGLLNLLAQVLDRFEAESGGHLLEATLCLLECSSTGLLETELLAILGDEDNLMPSDNKEKGEKGEKESREKTASDIGPLSAHKWARVFRGLKPFLRPFGDSGEGRLDFYHRSLSKAVRAKYFDKGNSEASDSVYKWWHSKLADYFEGVKSLERKAEEYPHHLIKIEDKIRLPRFLTEWPVFHLFFNEEFSAEMLSFWRSAGGMDVMEKSYTNSLKNMEVDSIVSKEDLALHYEKVARLLMQASQLTGSFALLEEAIRLEERELGARQDRMMELTDLAASMHNERLTLHDWITQAMMADLKPSIEYRRKSLKLGEGLTGERNRFKRAFSLMKLTFNLKTWYVLNGDNSMSGEEGMELGFDSIKEAKAIFEELGDKGHVSECLMNEGLLIGETDQERAKKVYKEALDLCLQVFGEMSVLSSRLFTNTAILYEECGMKEDAYDYFMRAKKVKVEVFGEDHPQTKRVLRVLEEPMYNNIAMRRKREETKT